MTEREKLEALSKGYNDLIALQKAQRITMATLIRVCLKQLKSPDSRKRAEGIKALADLADMMESQP